jgi:cell division protein FtsZ
LTVTIISSLAADEDLIPQQTQPALSSAPANLPVWEQPQEIPPKIEIEPEPTPMEVSEPMDMIPFDEPAPIETAPPPPVDPAPNKPEPIVSPPHKTPVKEAKLSTEKSVQAKQEVLQFEAVTRGRFEKSEPTIVEGEDLDVPTYLRKNIKVK